MPRLSALTVALLSSLAVTAAASSAAADAPSAGASAGPAYGCSVSTIAPGTVLPANAPAVFLTDYSQGATATITAELVTGDLRASMGGPVKDAHGITVLMFPNPPHSTGEHKIATKVVCSNTQYGRDGSSETSIVLTAPVAFPTSVGTLSVQANPEPKGIDQIVLAATPELRAFAAVSRLKLVVNGDETKASGAQFHAGSSSITFSAHTGSVCIENGALHREQRIVEVTVSADIAGVANSPASATIDVPVDCGAIKWTSSYDYDRKGASTTTPGGQELMPTIPVNEGNGSAGGCSAAPVTGFAGSTGALVAGAVAVLAGLRRRRSAQSK